MTVRGDISMKIVNGMVAAAACLLAGQAALFDRVTGRSRKRATGSALATSAREPAWGLRRERRLTWQI
jgi:hypothetical protein